MLCCMLVFSACQKQISDFDSSSPSEESLQPKTYTEDLTSGTEHEARTFNLSYDTQGRLISMVDASSSGDKFIYSYKAQNLFQLTIYIANEVTLHEDFYLKNASLIDSTFQINDTQDTTTEKYIYNTANQLIEERNYFYSEATGAVLNNKITFQYAADGTVTKQTDDDTVTTFEYYDDLPYTPVNLSPYTFQSPKLIKTATLVSDGEKMVQQHTYTFDDQKRITTETVTIADEDITVVRSYTY